MGTVTGYGAPFDWATDPDFEWKDEPTPEQAGPLVPVDDDPMAALAVATGDAVYATLKPGKWSLR